MIIEDPNHFVQLLKVPNLCDMICGLSGEDFTNPQTPLLDKAPAKLAHRSTTITPMLVVFYRVVLQTCASPELSFLVPAQVKLNLLKLTGNVNMSLIMQAILAELTNAA